MKALARRFAWYVLFLAVCSIKSQTADEPFTLVVRAYIDGRSQLVVGPESLHWEHFEHARPGRWNELNEPTYLNSYAWYPAWPNNDNATPGPSLPLPAKADLSEEITLTIREARWAARIIQQPKQSAGLPLIIEFDDDPPDGPAWYEIILSPVSAILPPVIVQQPLSQAAVPATTITFSVSANGVPPIAYQWRFKGVDINGATNAGITITSVGESDLGTYTVLVSNLIGSVESAPATLQFLGTTNYPEIIKQDSPVAYWRLGEASSGIAIDEIGANDGILLNGVSLGRTGAVLNDPNTAAHFSAAQSSKIDVPFTKALNSAKFSAEVWAKVTGGADYRSPLTSRGDGPQSGYLFYAGPDNTWQFTVGTSQASTWTTLQGPEVQPNTYAHLVGTYDGTNACFYVNGVLYAKRRSLFVPNAGNPLRIGGGATEGPGDFFFEGDVDEVAFYNYPLTQQQILAHYFAAIPQTTAPTITVQPTSQSSLEGGNVSFSVVAIGGQPLTYQWKFNDEKIALATNSSFRVTNVSGGHVGDYSVTVSNENGSTLSQVATLGIPASSGKRYDELVKADGAVAYWRLAETSGSIAKDEVGHNDASFINGVTFGVEGAIPGDTNTSVHFAAARRQKADVSWNTALNPLEFTVELWARQTAPTGDYASPLTSRADNPQRGYVFYVSPTNTWQFWSGKGNSSGWDRIPGPRVMRNQWTHLAVTYDGATKRFYVNGTEVGRSGALFGRNNMFPLRFGGGATEGSGNFFFDGDVDEPAVYNKALTQEQIIVHYLASQKSPPKLAIAEMSATPIISWVAGTLQTAPDLDGPWQSLVDAKSPLFVSPQPGEVRFYRLAP